MPEPLVRHSTATPLAACGISCLSGKEPSAHLGGKELEGQELDTTRGDYMCPSKQWPAKGPGNLLSQQALSTAL